MNCLLVKYENEPGHIFSTLQDGSEKRIKYFYSTNRWDPNEYGESYRSIQPPADWA